MADKVIYKVHEPLQPEKVVIMTGPTFGNALLFMLLGVAMGAGAVYFLGSKSGGMAGGTSGEDAVVEGLTGDGNKPAPDSAQLMSRLNSLSRRVRSLAGRARDMAKTASETLGPSLSDAVSEARAASRETQENLQKDLKSSPDEPSTVREQA